MSDFVNTGMTLGLERKIEENSSSYAPLRQWKFLDEALINDSRKSDYQGCKPRNTVVSRAFLHVPWITLSDMSSSLVLVYSVYQPYVLEKAVFYYLRSLILKKSVIFSRFSSQTCYISNLKNDKNLAGK